MKEKYFLCVLLLMVIRYKSFANEADSVYLFSYANTQNDGRSGLLFAWSIDNQEWHTIGNDFGFVYSDYGRWGNEKRMIQPVIMQGPSGLWQAIWYLDHTNTLVAYTESKDLQLWKPQTFLLKENEISPLLTVNQINTMRERQKQVLVLGHTETGSVNKVPWILVDGLIKKVQIAAYHNNLWGETTKQDTDRFAGLQSVSVSIAPTGNAPKKISDMLVGAFFEDINYAADGGLYAELVQNRDFEYTLSDKEYKDRDWTHKKAWQVLGNGIEFTIDSVLPISTQNKYYAKLDVKKEGIFSNEGFDGIPVQSGEKYNFSFFIKRLSASNGGIDIRLVDKQGTILACASTKGLTNHWKSIGTILTATGSSENARLEIVPHFSGHIALDMVSLFPQKTFRNHKNGLRADLAQAIADLHPKFLRFPGGCVAHGDGLENIYYWKNTIGRLEDRIPQRNLWGYHQTGGLGYYEYFQFCEDIGAAPVPILAAGVPCQNSEKHGHQLGGQQGGIPMSEMQNYIQEILDLIEWANGDIHTQWGKRRANAGHPKPFNLKYIGIGNEDLISTVFKERFTMIFNAIKIKHPEITVVGTVGPFFEGSDYSEGWKFARSLNVPVVDEHYYVPPGWFVYNQDFYDKYDHKGPMVYVGEYAAHLPGRPNNMETALAEAVHLTTLERNGDVVKMSSYAPLLAKASYTQWRPDMIYFNNTTVTLTTDYFVQQLFGQNAGDEYIPTQSVYDDNNEKVKNRIAWSLVKDSKSKELIFKVVNLLPVKTTIRLDCGILHLKADVAATKTILEGHPDAKDSQPQHTTVPIQELSNTQLNPYSFTVFRMACE
ncbi:MULTISPECIES: alpha-L-arabinofuranosidase C-terminal domain-containing protein [Chitinophagaceae]